MAQTTSAQVQHLRHYNATSKNADLFGILSRVRLCNDGALHFTFLLRFPCRN